MNIIKRMWGSGVVGDAVVLAPGEFFIHRAQTSPKAGRNLLFRAQLTLQAPSEEFVSELVVSLADDESDSDADVSADDLRKLESERTFLVDAALRIAYCDLHGATVISWIDPEGDAGDRYEFVCGQEISHQQLQKFDVMCRSIQYGRKYGKKPASQNDLDEFDFDAIVNETAPPAPQGPIEGTSLYSTTGDVCIFDAKRGVFSKQQEAAPIDLVEKKPFVYSLAAGSLVVPIGSHMSPVCNEESAAFIFNVSLEDAFTTFLVRFAGVEQLKEFEQQFTIMLWQSQNKTKWADVSQADRDYLSGVLVPEPEPVASDNESEGEEPESDDEEFEQEGDEYDNWRRSRAERNSAMEVGRSKDRTYVVRGSNIGVFKTGDDVEFSTTINNVVDLQHNELNAKQILLHEQDRALILQGQDANKLYRMDLERGQVVEEWDMDSGVTSYAPLSKFAQSTAETNLVATGDKSVYRIDPRLAGSKIVEDASKKYASKVGFSAVATTEAGFVAVGSQMGDIRLYNQLGKVAKTHIPAVGDKVLALDVTADGKWLLATFKTYLLLIETSTDEINGYTKSFPKAAKPKPYRLQISPDNTAWMYRESGKPISYTPARFDAGPNAKEQSIITASGPYIITWSLDAVVHHKANPYRIKRYDSEVTADNFKYNSSNRVVVTLENQVGMVSRSALRKPTRASLSSTQF